MKYSAMVAGTVSSLFMLAAQADNHSAANEEGKTLYSQYCGVCHGSELQGRFGPALRGSQFGDRWNGKPIAELLSYIEEQMPPPKGGILNKEQIQHVLSYVFQANSFPAGIDALLASPQALMSKVALPSSEGAASKGAVIPPPLREVKNPLASLSPVTAESLRNPAESDWLMWRRTYNAAGFSPLTQINATNVWQLPMAWAWTLPSGRGEVTPLVHDGVMFVYGHGDNVYAFNAVNGDLLWHRQRQIARGSTFLGLAKRAMALYEDKLYFATADTHLVALAVKTGEVVWEKAVADFDAGYFLTSGPLIAKGKVIIGTTSQGTRAPSNFIVALDAATGKEAWRVNTIPGPGEPGGDSWNGLPANARVSAGAWMPGSYDPELNLVFFGTGIESENLKPIPPAGKSNDIAAARHTNSTLAINPDTGQLKWFYQHLAHDLNGADWAFERALLDLKLAGKTQRVVAAGGKLGIYDVLQARDGKYVTSVDPGLQNVVASINPKTGAKLIQKMPLECMAKSWMPMAVNPSTQILYIPLHEFCDEQRVGGLSNPRPHPGGDGNFGRLQAINLNTRQTLWTSRFRAVPTTGVLATAGNLLFVGMADRTFAAFDQNTGDEKWRVRLNEMPNGAPVSYSVDGVQYIAVMTGGDGFYTSIVKKLTPETHYAPKAAAMIWVFRLPTDQKDVPSK